MDTTEIDQMPTEQRATTVYNNHGIVIKHGQLDENNAMPYNFVGYVQVFEDNADHSKTIYKDATTQKAAIRLSSHIAGKPINTKLSYFLISSLIIAAVVFVLTGSALAVSGGALALALMGGFAGVHNGKLALQKRTEIAEIVDYSPDAIAARSTALTRVKVYRTVFTDQMTMWLMTYCSSNDAKAKNLASTLREKLIVGDSMLEIFHWMNKVRMIFELSAEFPSVLIPMFDAEVQEVVDRLKEVIARKKEIAANEGLSEANMEQLAANEGRKLIESYMVHDSKAITDEAVNFINSQM